MSEEQRPDREVLVSVNRAMTTARLMAGAVHEVNNALQVIAGSVELLEQHPLLPPGIAKSLDRIKRQSERAASALADLQVFTKAPLEGRERFNLREVAAHALALRRYAAGRLGLTVEAWTDDPGVFLAQGNAGYAQQALLNLLINAEQAMTGMPGTLRVRMRGENDKVGVEVSDSGPGLSEIARQRLFEPFATTRSPGDGAGLGLWVSRSIAEAVGGSIEVASTETGTTAVLWLPRG